MDFTLPFISVVFEAIFLGCLMFLAMRIRSVGIFLIWVTLLIGKIFNWVFFHFLLRDMRSIPFTSGYSSIEIFTAVTNFCSWIILTVCSIGVLLIYTEWKQGKFKYSEVQ